MLSRGRRACGLSSFGGCEDGIAGGIDPDRYDQRGRSQILEPVQVFPHQIEREPYFCVHVKRAAVDEASQRLCLSGNDIGAERYPRLDERLIAV